MDQDAKDILKFMSGCGAIGVLAVVGTIWGIVAAFKWAFA